MKKTVLLVLAGACAGTPTTTPPAGDREPELHSPSDVLASKISMSDGIAQLGADVIEAKFEPDDSGNLSLSIYPVASLALDSERNTFQEAAGDPTHTPWTPGTETFHDFEHLTRSSRDLTLRQLSATALEDVVAKDAGMVYWAVPTIRDGRAGYGIWALHGEDGTYAFVDGGGDDKHETLALGTGPGSAATDARTPELGSDITIVRSARVKMSDALRQVNDYPQVIEAKYELGDDGKLSLSIYVTSHGKDTAAEHQDFFELAGDPTQATYAPSAAKFDVPDEEHVTRSARDLTLIQTQTMSLLDAVTKAESLVASGVVFWAIPTIRGTRAGYGVYILAPDNSVHYYFLS